jgi:hypothetical protein
MVDFSISCSEQPTVYSERIGLAMFYRLQTSDGPVSKDSDFVIVYVEGFTSLLAALYQLDSPED